MLALVLAATLQVTDVPPNLTDAETQARLVFLDDRLRAGATAAKVWYWSWTALYTAGTLVQLALFVTAPDLRAQANWGVGGATTLLGLLLMVIPEFPAEFAARELDRMPADTPELRARKLRRAQELLESSAEAEAGGTAWFIHLGGAAVSIAGGLILWLGFGYLVDGIINAVSGFAITEAQIWTQPTRATRDWEEYRARFLPAAPANKVSVRVLPAPGGFAVAGTF